MGPVQLNRMYIDLTGKRIRFTASEIRLLAMRKRIALILGESYG